MLETPASKVIKAFGGVRATARALGRNPSSVSRWQIDRELGGTAGNIPSSLRDTILRYAAENSLSITASDLEKI